MPSYSGNGSNPGPDSWRNLIGETYKLSGYNIYGANQPRHWPLNYMNTGEIYFTEGFTRSRTGSGRWWGMTSSSARGGFGLNITSSNPFLNLSSSAARGYGKAIRCVVRS